MHARVIFIFVLIVNLLGLPVNSRPTFGKDDLLFTLSVPLEHTPLLEATRVWRRGIRAHFVVDSHVNLRARTEDGISHNETYTAMAHIPSHPVVIRHVLTLLLAYHAAGENSFKWLLLGDADTIFNIPAVLRFINKLELSADDSHMLSDFLLSCPPCHEMPCPQCHGPISIDPRCMPCPGGVSVCPCILPATCTQVLNDRAAFEAGGSAGQAGCPIMDNISAYGGVGVIYSVGLLRRLMRDPKYFLPLAFKHLTDRPYGDLVFGEASRRLGTGYTVLPPRPSAANVDVSRNFGTYSPWNDNRPVLQQVQDLQALKERDPGVFRDVLSYHLRVRFSLNNFTGHILPAYLAVAKLVGLAADEDVV